MPCFGLRKDGRFSLQLYAEYCIFEPEDRGIHVHFGGAESLSPGDKLYIGQILEAMPEEITCLYFPVVKMPEREMVVYRASNDHGKIKIEKEPILYQGGIDDGES